MNEWNKKKKRKMRKRKVETLTFCYIRRFIVRIFIYFVFFALIFKFNLFELILRTFFIACYVQKFWCFEHNRFSIVCWTFHDSIKQFSKFNYFFTISKHVEKRRRRQKNEKKSNSIVLMMSRKLKNIFFVEFDIQQKRFEFSFFQKLNQIIRYVDVANFRCNISTKKMIRIIVFVF